MVYEVKAASVEWNPDPARLRELTEKMPNSQVTEFGNVVVKARVDARSTRSTFMVEDSTNATKQTITREEYDRVAAEPGRLHRRRARGRRRRLHRHRPGFRTRARLVMEAANANVAGMQQQLYYPAGDDYDPATGSPTPRSSTRPTWPRPATRTTASSPWT